MPTRLEQQLAFLVEADKLKNVLRQTRLTSNERRENSAEHSWHLTLTAIVLREYAAEPIDLSRVLKMLIVHDVVEIDAGDTFAYDAAGNASKAERERVAADRLFGLLPTDLAKELRPLWEEFDANATPDACFANAVDRAQPFLQNLHTRGGTWRTHNLTYEQVLVRMDPIRTAMPALWPFIIENAKKFFDEAAKGA
ncbi:MAG: HD domain-containing protein [Acidobacteria bacterium]|nr:HD domain-containing protein [Acidobacteriota bacterium]